MNRVLLIADLKRGVFLTMPEVLAALPAESASFDWHILDLGDVVAHDDSELNVLKLEERVFSSPRGLPMSFTELEEFAGSTRQVIDGLFVATERAAPPPLRTDDDATVLRNSEAVVAAVDSTFWLVAAPDSWLDRLAGRFDDVHWKRPGEIALRTWGVPES